MITVPTTVYELEDQLALRLGAPHQDIVSALLAIVRHISERLNARSPVRPAVDEALDVLEAWCGGKQELEPVLAASESVDKILNTPRGPARRSLEHDVLLLLLGALRKARYDDHDDWPSEVVGTAADALCRLGEEEPRAVKAIADILQRHRIL
jgi:hypothetical protein